MNKNQSQKPTYKPVLLYFSDYHEIEAFDALLLAAKTGYRCIEVGFLSPSYVGMVYKTAEYQQVRRHISEVKKLFLNKKLDTTALLAIMALMHSIFVTFSWQPQRKSAYAFV